MIFSSALLSRMQRGSLILRFVFEQCGEFVELFEGEIEEEGGVGIGVFGMRDFVEGDGFVFVGFVVGNEAVDIVGGAIKSAAEFLHNRQADFIVLAGGDAVGEVGADAVLGEETAFVFYIAGAEEGFYVVLQHGFELLVTSLEKMVATNEKNY